MSSTETAVVSPARTIADLISSEILRDQQITALACVEKIRKPCIEIECWRALILLDGIRDVLWSAVDRIDREIAAIVDRLGDAAIGDSEAQRLAARRAYAEAHGADFARVVLENFSAALRA